MYLVRLRKPPRPPPGGGDWRHCQDIAKLALMGAGISNPLKEAQVKK